MIVSEFDFINNIKSRFRLDAIGDDCAILPKSDTVDMLVTADMLMENVDFRIEWTTPEFLGHKSLAVSLSDIAAMGGNPIHALLSIAVPDHLWITDFLDRFYEGWHDLARRFDVELVGGDISRSPGPLAIDSTVFGDVEKNRAIRRSGAKPGDSIFVTGYLGGAAAGLADLEAGRRFDHSLPAPIRHLHFRQLQPIPHVQTGKLVLEHGLATAMLDISDGLSSDLRHLTTASSVGCYINLEQIPVDPAISLLDLSADQAIDLALNGGEDFELLLTVDEKNFSSVQDLGFHHIGEVTANVGVIKLSRDGEESILEPLGYRHF